MILLTSDLDIITFPVQCARICESFDVSYLLVVCLGNLLSTLYVIDLKEKEKENSYHKFLFKDNSNTISRQVLKQRGTFNHKPTRH